MLVEKELQSVTVLLIELIPPWEIETAGANGTKVTGATPGGHGWTSGSNWMGTKWETGGPGGSFWPGAANGTDRTCFRFNINKHSATAKQTRPKTK